MAVTLKGVRPELEIRSRSKVLFNVVDEMARGLGVADSALETIRKGILDRQLLRMVSIYYLNDLGRLVGVVNLEVNWQLHEVLATTGEKETFEVDPRSSIAEQLSKVFPQLVRHAESLRKALGVTRVETRYSYRFEVVSDAEKLAEARRFLGTVPGEAPKWSSEDEASNGLVIEFSSGELEELELHMKHVKK